MSESDSSNRIEPFLRWAGGKRSIVSYLKNYLPSDIQDRLYIEPFLGAGSLFFALRPKSASLADSNPHLIDCFIFVRDCPNLVYYYLHKHGNRTSEKYYYKIRDEYNRSYASAAQAARFIYLNKTCFNGIFRVNRKGKFNVPYGRKEPPFLPDKKWLQIASDVLKSAIIRCSNYDIILATADIDDFIYLDPPYPPLNDTSNFTHYTKEHFNIRDHRRLAETMHELDARGCLVMMSNADIPIIHELYKRFRRQSLPVRRYITCKSVKHLVSELIITNY